VPPPDGKGGSDLRLAPFFLARRLQTLFLTTAGQSWFKGAHAYQNRGGGYNFIRFETFGNRDPSARWTFFDPAPPRFAAKTKLALRAQTVVFAGATLRGQGAPKNLQCALPGSDFQVAQRSRLFLVQN